MILYNMSRNGRKPVLENTCTDPVRHKQKKARGLKLSLCLRKPTIWVLTRSDTNQPVQSQKQARSLKFWIEEVEGLYYTCSENKGADQLRVCREADLRLCFRLCRLLIFPCSGSIMKRLYYSRNVNKGTDLLCHYCTADLRLGFAYAKSLFSHDAAQIHVYMLVLLIFAQINVDLVY